MNPQANVTIDPSSAAPGAVAVTLTGSSFLSGEAFIVKATSAGGVEEIVGSGVANAGGGFQVSGLTVTASAGVYSILAEGVNGSLASAPLVIAAK